LGFDKDYLLQIPLSWNELLPINDIDTICSSFDAYLAKGKEDAIEIDIPFLQKNSRINFLKCRAIAVNANQLSYVENKYNPILNDYGKVIGATVFIHDVTKEKKAEIANKINELSYASLFSGASDAIFIANSKTGYIVDVNLKAEELMGYTKSELVTMHQSQIHPPELLEEIKVKLKEFTSTDEFHLLETFILTKNGHRIPVQITAGSSFRIGDEIFSAAYFKDITSRKIIAKELEKQQQQLKEIAWTQSHLVRAPLTRIMGLANALQKGIVPDCEIATYLKFIKSSSDELDKVIREITSKTVVN